MREPKLITHITYSYQPVAGGADRFLAQLHRVLADQGFGQAVVQRKATGVEPYVVSLPGIPGVMRRAEFWLLPVLVPLKWSLCRKSWALVCHYAPYWLPVAWHKRTVVVSHGVYWDDAPGSLRSRIKRALARLAYRRAWRFVANDSNFFREMGVPLGPRERMFQEVARGRWFIPNCVDTEFFQRCEPDRAFSGHPVILVPRNVYRNRGVHLAVEAFLGVAARYPRALLAVVGSSDAQPGYRAELDILAQRLALSSKVVYPGHVPWNRMPSVYSAAQLTLIPSVAGEGTSLAALESMACGTPVVATRVGGLVDLPCLHADPTPESLEQAMLEALERRDDLAAEQARAVRENFALPRWQAAWKRVLGDDGR